MGNMPVRAETASHDSHSSVMQKPIQPTFSQLPLSLVYSTYLGGNDGDRGTGIAVDSMGNAYIVGSTSSADFPATHKFADSGIFVTKLDPSGSNIVYSTILSGSFHKFANVFSVKLPAPNSADLDWSVVPANH